MNIKMIFKSVIVLCLLLIIDVSGKKQRIIGGRRAKIENFPFAVSLRNITDKWHFCGGTIITKRHVLTAAHCIFDLLPSLFEIRIYAGTTNLSDPSATVHEIANIDIHDQFNEDPDSNHDIGVLTLKYAMTFDKYHQAIPLTNKDVKTGDVGIICGWGTIDFSNAEAYEELQQSKMRVIDKQQCIDSLLPPIYDEQICLYDRVGVGACKGDSGSPFIIDGKLVGVSSFVVPCAIAHPDVYTSVFHHLDFIRSIIHRSNM